VYVAGNLTLAMLELLVHVEAESLLALRYVYHRVDFPEEAMAVLDPASLPDDWNARPESRSSQVIGDEWLERAETPVLAVPSVVVPPAERCELTYMNFLVNSKHEAFDAQVDVGPVRDLVWDPRLTA
jgi:RES domain-containing protein